MYGRAMLLAMVLTVGLLGLLALAGCEERTAAPGEPGEVRLGYFANVTHAQAVLGVASGDYARAVAPAGLTTRVFNAGPSVIEALFAGEIDVAYIGPGPVLNAHARSRGQGVCVVAGGAANGVVIVARPDSGIRTLADLKDKRIATPQHGNTQDIAARRYLKVTLGQSSLANVLPVPNAEQVAMMSRGQIDAAWAPEPWGQRLVQEAGGVIIAEEKDLWPGQEFGLTVVITTPEFLRDHPETLKRLLASHVQWTGKLQDDPQGQTAALGQAVLALTGKGLPEGVLPAALGRVRFTNQPLPATFETMGQWAYEVGFAQGPPDLTGLFDLSILQQVEAER